MVNELTVRCIGIGCAPLHSIKFTLRKTWYTCMCERARDQSRSIFLLTDAYAFDVCTFSSPSSPASAVLIYSMPATYIVIYCSF